jgi:acetaldehyde dehydrogenase (acetylating)
MSNEHRNRKKAPRLSLPKTVLPRIYRIDAAIASGKHPNSDDLARMCETSVSTKDEGILIEFIISKCYKVLKWVFSCSCSAVPHKPKQLVDDWKRRIAESSNLRVSDFYYHSWGGSIFPGS